MVRYKATAVEQSRPRQSKGKVKTARGEPRKNKKSKARKKKKKSAKGVLTSQSEICYNTRTFTNGS